jgi:hypothetical protein
MHPKGGEAERPRASPDRRSPPYWLHLSELLTEP